mmetsp:Transcript_27309/g.31172  ORF Transcript_27309/g.31172 Transcript_27309/m.31172 type:complete len:215 (+) Transcript_27309:195-839(+)|eukprot:CAMPEP_0194149916 /NCGR_PEP_ID=MMETSP0152-20130528/40525_1 /TAXON_ID=1049557 /ORGANISM="Thalassiothrix antarctica, Strain L6-D1" /LENGTH=214 /DNA_ID=CAMNT_0038852449 /DNA_START=121 /DNA_END=765 /DNA_ORIENTATION=+
MTLSREENAMLERLRKPKYNPVKGFHESLFKLHNTRLIADSQYLSIDYKLNLSAKELDFCMRIFRDNMTQLYRSSSWGLNLIQKRQELQDNNARYLLVTTNNQVIGFCHFRFDVDDDYNPSAAVLYVFELQILSRYRNYGIGSRLMEIIHLIAEKARMRKVMLTVFLENEAAMSFYKRLGYATDRISPSMYSEDTDYEIMSKCTYYEMDSDCIL